MKARQFFNGSDTLPPSDRRAIVDLLSPFVRSPMSA